MSRYTNKEGIDYPSVTEVLGLLDKSSALTQWAANCVVDYIKKKACKQIDTNDVYVVDNTFLDDARFHFREISEEAKNIGSEVHHLIEAYIKAKIQGKEFDPTANTTDYRNEVQNGFLAFLEWEQKNNIKWLESELTIYDDDLYYAGTLDAVADIDGKITVIDFKSSKGFYDGYGEQISAYAYAYNKTSDIKATNCMVVRFDKETGLPEEKDYTKGVDKLYNAFIKLLDFYYAYKKRRLKNNPRVKECI